MDILSEYELKLYLHIKAIVKNKVYLVEHQVTNQFYIKKILNKEYLNIYHKLKIKKSINRVKVYEYFLTKDSLIVIEELINGQTIENILQIEEIKNKDAISIAIQICNGLKDIHNMDNPIIHRDIKPSNIIINEEGIVKIIDFDAARISNEINNRDTRIIGTVGYASPEQFGFAQTDVRSDIYSIGVLLNYMIIKKYPSEKLVEGDLGKIIKKATETDREYRYQSVEELEKVLSILNFNDIDINANKEKIVSNKFIIKKIGGCIREKDDTFIILLSYSSALTCGGLFFYSYTIREVILIIYIFILLGIVIRKRLKNK